MRNCDLLMAGTGRADCSDEAQQQNQHQPVHFGVEFSFKTYQSANNVKTFVNFPKIIRNSTVKVADVAISLQK